MCYFSLPFQCANGGTCRIAGTTYVCLCPPNFTGLTCLQSLNLCSTIQCLNGGSCINYGTFATCSCLTAYTGDRCQFINQCFPLSPCLFGGTCIAVLNSYSCQCPPGRTGATCQLLADSPCGSGFRCANGGTCIVLSGTATASCRCTPNYTGQNCEQGLRRSSNFCLFCHFSSNSNSTNNFNNIIFIGFNNCFSIFIIHCHGWNYIFTRFQYNQCTLYLR